MSVLTFVVLGVLLSALIWLLQRRQWKAWIRFLWAAGIFLCLALVIYPQAGPVTLGTEHRWYQTSPLVEGWFFLLMLAGMGARYVTKAIEVRREKIAELSKQDAPFDKPGLEFDVWEFSYPLLVSVVTYGALLTQLKDHTLTAGNAILSFQTGFFWQTLLVVKQGEGH